MAGGVVGAVAVAVVGVPAGAAPAGHRGQGGLLRVGLADRRAKPTAIRALCRY
jgi:hypothetical protein